VVGRHQYPGGMYCPTLRNGGNRFFCNIGAHIPDYMVSFVNFTILSVSRLYNSSDRTINEYEAVGGMKSDKEN
jgi:hypothetical protein